MIYTTIYIYIFYHLHFLPQLLSHYLSRPTATIISYPRSNPKYQSEAKGRTRGFSLLPVMEKSGGGGCCFLFFWQWLFSVFFIFFFNWHPLNCAVNCGTKLSVTLQKDTGNDNAIQKSAWRFAPRGLSYGSTVNKILTYISAALEENLKLEHGNIISFNH